MKYIILFLIPISVSGQPKNKMDEYTYFIQTFYQNLFTYYTGSGFFIKNNQKTFFITNYHVYAGKINRTNGIKNYEIDQIIISGEKSNKVNIHISSKRDTILENKILNYDAPDLICIEVSNLEPILEISKFVDTTFFSKVPKRIYVYGFPSEKVDINTHLPKGLGISCEFVKYDSLFMIKRTEHRPPGMEDTTFLRKFEQKLFFVKKLNGFPGMSGSPVFGEYEVNKKIFIKFMGVYSALSTVGGLGGIIPAKEVVNVLNEAKKLSYQKENN